MTEKPKEDTSTLAITEARSHASAVGGSSITPTGSETRTSLQEWQRQWGGDAVAVLALGAGGG